MKIKLNSRIHDQLREALRRHECFNTRGDRTATWSLEDLQRFWTGLGTKTAYKEAVEAGYMEFDGKYAQRADGWLKLTETGAKIVLTWHNMGYKCSGNGYELNETLPFEVEI